MSILPSLAVVLLYCLVFIVATVMASLSFRLRHILGFRALIVSMTSQCFVATMALAIFAIDDFETKVELSRLRFLGLSLLAPCGVVLVNSIYTQWRWIERRWVLALLFLPSAVTWAFTLVPSWRDLVVTDFRPVEVMGLSVLQFAGGPWFKGHFLSSFGFGMLIAAQAVYVLGTGRGQKRRQITFLLSSCILVFVVDIYVVLTGSPLRWAMLSGALFLVADVALLYTGVRDRFFDIVPYATEMIFRELPDPVVVVSDGRLLEIANDSALEIFGIDRGHFGRPLSPPMAEALFGEREIHLQRRHFDVIREPVSGSGTIVHLREITLRKEIERSLSTNLEFKSQMLSLIAHDVVGSLRAQNVLMDKIKNEFVGEAKSVVGLLADSNAALDELLRNLINWEKSQNQSFQVVKAPFDVRLFAANCIESIALPALVREIRIDTVIEPPNPPFVTADSELLATVLRNLLSNAIRASRDGGRIELRIRVTERLEIEVADQGVGMDPERLRQCLEETDEPTLSLRSRNGGFGIGLSLARRLIRLHQGEFAMTSELNSGTQVRFSVAL